MKCVEREQLFAYAQRMLEPGEEGEVRGHLEQCAVCREGLEAYQRLDAMLEEWKPTEPSPWFDARVHAAVAPGEPAETTAAFFGLPWGRWLAPAVLVVLVLTGSLLVLRSRRPQGVPPPTARQALPKATVASPTAAPSQAVAEGDADELSLYQNLPVLEDYEMLANFDVLSELPRGDQKVAN